MKWEFAISMMENVEDRILRYILKGNAYLI